MLWGHGRGPQLILSKEVIVLIVILRPIKGKLLVNFCKAFYGSDTNIVVSGSAYDILNTCKKCKVSDCEGC